MCDNSVCCKKILIAQSVSYWYRTVRRSILFVELINFEALCNCLLDNSLCLNYGFLKLSRFKEGQMELRDMMKPAKEKRNRKYKGDQIQVNKSHIMQGHTQHLMKGGPLLLALRKCSNEFLDY